MHLSEVAPPSSTDAEASLAILEFGTPREIVEQEQSIVRPQRRGDRRGVIAIVLSVAAALVVSALVAGTMLSRPSSATREESPEVEVTSVVSETPLGPERVSDGQAYAEYLAEIDALEPLPEGAEWPIGVPAGLDAGSQPEGMLESGAGTNVARFTWLCAWEDEYVDAEDAGADERKVAAADQLEWWSAQPFLSQWDPGGGWTRNVILPMRFDDSSGIRADFPNSCAQAFILGISAR
ncbi:hypothetical protein [Salinibacterium sp. CAN_S4]|uniref:hypothetical protein n=1 Tax=Salinibacterium sp. CAN_S4 TaxID=2787727 RepID=UPI0018EF6897